jgi:hypothetical protein
MPVGPLKVGLEASSENRPKRVDYPRAWRDLEGLKIRVSRGLRGFFASDPRGERGLVTAECPDKEAVFVACGATVFTVGICVHS